MGGNQSEALQKEIDRLEKTKFESQVATDYNEKYQIILAFGFLFALLDLLISDRKGQGHIWKGRFEIAES
jgi:Ca-activated chloride channel family protein